MVRVKIESDGLEHRYLELDGREWVLVRQPLGDEWQVWSEPDGVRRAIIDSGQLLPDMGMMDDENAALLVRVATAAGLVAKWPPTREWGGN
jgi:hypothetical protein